ncbi:MAG: ATP-binding protein [Chloroflexi bacterium]|nr:ATP-binding protein [Chloroflexota bacterium]
MPDNSRTLLNFVAQVAGDRYLKIEKDLGDGFVELKLSEADKRQAKHDIRSVEDIAVELLRNSRDASSNIIFFATTKENQALRHVTVIDDGEGIPLHLQTKVFDPRVTSRLSKIVQDAYGVHGRGMALFAIRQIAREASIRFAAPARGCCIRVAVELSVLPEKKDQSTMPVVKRRGGDLTLVGPHNLPRVVLEFAVGHPEIEVYYGSPAEILSTMYWLSRPLVGNKAYGELLVNPDVKFWRCMGGVRDASQLATVARDRLGLIISERNASRIVRKEIEPVTDITGLFGAGPEKRSRREVKLEGALPVADRISPEDLDAFTQAVIGSLKQLGQKYYLSPAVTRIDKEGNTLVIRVELADQEPV